jgi:transcription antitermination factor NusG
MVHTGKTIDVETVQWFALQIRSQHEKIVASTLREKGYEEFLPLCQIKRRWSDRVKRLEAPLFPGYVFCRFDVQKRLPILVTPGVRSIIGVGKIPLPIDDSEIAALQSIVKSGLPAEPWPFLKIGQRVRIEQGSLEGIEGILLTPKNSYRLIVSVTLLQRSVAVEIDRNWVTPISSHKQLSVPSPSYSLAPKAAWIAGSH